MSDTNLKDSEIVETWERTSALRLFYPKISASFAAVRSQGQLQQKWICRETSEIVWRPIQEEHES